MAKIERTRNASRNIFFGVILKAYQILVPFLMRTAMIYLMGVQYLGLNSLFTSILQVLNLAELGVGSAMVYSMYKPIAEDDNATSPADHTAYALLKEQLDEVLEQLTDREENVLRLRFGLDKNGEIRTLEQVGQVFGVTRERIRQIEGKALTKLRNRGKRDKIKDFL